MAKQHMVTLEHVTFEELVTAFTEWERAYREDPKAFMDEVTRLLGHTPETYGEKCAAHLAGLLMEGRSQ